MGQYTGVTENVSSFIQNKLNSIYGAGTVTNVIEEDEILTVIFSNGDSISLTDSSKYGNYCNSQPPANTGNYEKNGNYGVKKNTGSNEAWKTNNIYDLAGNCYEWTQEAYSTANRARRGGGYLSSVDSGPVTFRGIYGNTNHTSLLDVTTRIVLFIK